jgi:multicomponent Na+:H+ antiporter subunit F
VRAVKGPTVWDRLLGLNLISTKIIVIIIVMASIYEKTFLLDFAIIYALSGFISTIFLALFLSERRLGKRRGKKE